MEKLIELLNEYDPYIASDGEFRDNFWYFIYKGGSAIFPKEIGMLKIISKEYGFIKWLVENDKIDYERFYDKVRNIITDFDLRGEYGWACNEVIMLLAIQDEPIEFLISILENM